MLIKKLLMKFVKSESRKKQLEKMPADILLSYIKERTIMLVRGFVIFKNPCFVGRNVEIKCKKE